MGWTASVEREMRDVVDRIERIMRIVKRQEREACAKAIEPTDEHRKDAWGYIGGVEGVDLLDNAAAAIRARGDK